jgi:hypothetical protein
LVSPPTKCEREEKSDVALALEPTAPPTQEGDVILLEDVKMERGPIQFVLPANKAEMIDAIAQLLTPLLENVSPLTRFFLRNNKRDHIMLEKCAGYSIFLSYTYIHATCFASQSQVFEMVLGKKGEGNYGG